MDTMTSGSISKRRSLRVAAGLVAAALGLVGGALRAQDVAIPRTVTLLVPYAAGGVTDALARALARRLAETWGVTVLVDNKPGAGTVIGTAAAARAPADGSTLLVTSFGFVGNQIMLPNLPYAPSSLTPVSLIGESTGVLFVHPSVPAANVSEFVRWLKARPAPAAFASSGNGSSVHVMAEMFGAAIGVPIVHVPYRGNAPGLADLIGGQVQAMFDSTGALTHARAGRLRALAVSTAQRSMLAPDLPTLAESGEPGLAKFDAGSWFGVFVPAGASPALQTRLHADINTALAGKGMSEEIMKAGVEPRLISQAAFADYLKRQLETWGPVIRAKNIRPD
jgi:tripartite-type tricarboxylate transporter receptor subunit TctC